MLGHEGVVRALTVRLRERLPQMVAQLRAELQVDLPGLPDIPPEQIHPSEVDAVSKGYFPVFMVSQDGTGLQQSTRQVDVFADHDEYEFRYRCRIVFYATGDSPERTEVQRKRLLLALRQTVLSDRILYDEGGEHAYIDHGYMREQFSELAQDGTGKLLAGAYLEIEIVTNEILRHNMGGPRAVFDVSAKAIQDSPAPI